MAFPAAVERWRPVVAKYFPPQLVDKALYVIQYESGGNPGAVGDGGAARGLFQIQDSRNFPNRPDAAYLDDPEKNIAYAAQQLGAASGNFGAWGEGTTYNGQPFGALGNHPYPGDSSMGNSPSSLGDLLANTENTDPSQQADLASQILAAISAARPNPQDFTKDDPYRPGVKVNADGLTFSDAMSAWVDSVGSAAQTASQLQQSKIGMATLPNGQVIPYGQLTPDQKAAVDASNQQAYRTLINQYRTDAYKMSVDNIQTNFQNRLSLLNSQIAIDDIPAKRADAEVTRMLNGLAEARQRAGMITDAQLKAQPYATSPGKTSFSGNDLGAAIMALARQAGISDPNASLINYPTTLTIDPAANMAAQDQALGVTGQLPHIPQSSIGMGDIPAAPSLPSPPSLLEPVAPQSRPAPAPNADVANMLAQGYQGGSGYTNQQSGGSVTTPGGAVLPAFAPPMAVFSQPGAKNTSVVNRILAASIASLPRPESR